MITDEASARQFVDTLADAAAVDRLVHLVSALKVENQKQNLISRGSVEEIWQRHIADSAQLLRFVPRETPGPWLDLGTGAGFPGLVIAAILPENEMVLVESRARRVEWLECMCEEMELTNCRVEGRRLELVKPFKASVISARAFAPLPKLLSLSAPFSTSRTIYLLPKGRSAAQELRELPAKSRKLFHVEQSLTNPEAGIIVSAK
ncbi:MAG TPA: 16S rRNA (guanine(527)-N(7))-methyltransferase RsmG [Erythrobacter sp.]|nr:16S rRNA (guanine(527)-N(7))-methyltransferase RsmG [Erythrobacter sp.]